MEWWWWDGGWSGSGEMVDGVVVVVARWLESGGEMVVVVVARWLESGGEMVVVKR